VRLKQETLFPKEPRTRLSVVSAPGGKWTIRLRVPAWTTEKAQVLINGRALEFTPQPGAYLNLTREWKGGDRIEMEMPMRLTRVPLGEDPSWQAFLYGPVVLAGQFPKGELSARLQHGEEDPKVNESPIPVPALQDHGESVEKWITPVDGQPLTFRTTASTGDEITLKPINESWQRFAVYFQIA
jgi:DUF1680 family protein